MAGPCTLDPGPAAWGAVEWESGDYSAPRPLVAQPGARATKSRESVYMCAYRCPTYTIYIEYTEHLK